MKVKKALTGLGLVTVLLTGGTCYAENNENPIVADTEYGYIRLNLPSVQKVDCFGRYFIQCTYSCHTQQYLPYGIPLTNDEGTEYVWFDPLTNRRFYFGKRSSAPVNIDISKMTDIGNGDLALVYGALQERFPELCAEVRTANQIANEKYGQELDKGLAAITEKDLEGIYLHFKKAYDKGCTSSQVLREMSKACWSMGDYDKALEWHSKAIEYAPSSEHYNERAWDYFLLGKNDQALADANMALSLDSNNADALDTRGCIYHDLGQYDKAIADFDKAIQLNKNLGHAYYYRSKCYNALGKKEKAAADYTKAKKLDSSVSDDKLRFTIERPKAAKSKRARHQNRLEKYQKDLKKLNDAIYVTNNPSNYPAKVVFESNGVVVSVVGNIWENEPEDFYQEVIPQEIRTNFENGTYQKQREQLQAELGIYAPPVATNGNGPKMDTNGTILEAPTTLPANTSSEIYDLKQPNALLKYTSEGTLYAITYEDPMITYRALKGNEVTPIEQEHGRYMLKHVIMTGDPYPDFSFDYDSASHTFTLYGGAGAKRTVHYDAASNTITVNHLDSEYSAYSGTYVYVPEENSYILYPGNHKLEANAAVLAKEHFNGDSDIGKHYTVYHGPAIDLEVTAYPEYKEQRPNLPAMWYKIINVEDPSDWIAFTYDKATRVFGMYNHEGEKILHYSNRWFRDANHIETHLTNTPMDGASDGIYVRDNDGDYYANFSRIRKYITDGMFNFMHYVKK